MTWELGTGDSLTVQSVLSKLIAYPSRHKTQVAVVMLGLRNDRFEISALKV